LPFIEVRTVPLVALCQLVNDDLERLELVLGDEVELLCEKDEVLEGRIEML
jgi:hypothetical protein